MAKKHFNSQKINTINGISGVALGDICIFAKSLNGENIVVTMSNDKEGTERKEYADGILTFIVRNGHFVPYIIPYRSLWGVSIEKIVYDEEKKLSSATPQSKFPFHRNLLYKGSRAITDSIKFAETAIVCEVGDLWQGTFRRKEKKDGQNTFTWGLVGLDEKEGFTFQIADNIATITMPNGSSVSETLEDIAQARETYFDAENAKVENLDL